MTSLQEVISFVLTWVVPLLLGAGWMILFLLIIVLIYKLTEERPIIVVLCYLPLQLLLHGLFQHHAFSLGVK